MAAPRLTESPTRKLKSTISSEVQLYVSGVPFNLDRELLAAKSGKLAALLKENPRVDLSHVLSDGLADPEIFEQVARFCHGYEIHLTTENVIHVACVAHRLEMTEDHCTNNLLSKAIDFFEYHILSSWSKSIRALKASEIILRQALDLGLAGACVESIITKALNHPNLLGEPLQISASNNIDDDDEEGNGINASRTNVRRKLFDPDWRSEDLSMLCVKLYEHIISSLIRRKVPPEYVCAAVCQYARRWVLSSMKEGDDDDGGSVVVYRKKYGQREIIEAVERMLPNEKGRLLPCASLFEMLKAAIVLEAGEECKNGFEIRVGKQLDEATVEDLLIPSQGYAKDEKYDTECVKRILKNFYQNYTAEDSRELITVAELVDNFLIEIASDIDLKMGTFMTFTELSSGVSEGIQRNSDGIYRAIDIYFDKHRYLTESEREEMCRVLDCNKMTAEACFHAAQNERLPLRVVVQVLFVRQLQLRDTIPKEEKGFFNEKLLLKYDQEEEEEEEEETRTRASNSEEEVVRAEMEKMGNKVLELERECHMMRREIENGGSSSRREAARKGKVSVWTEMKRKFGCITSTIHDRNCHVKKKKKKVHPR